MEKTAWTPPTWMVKARGWGWNEKTLLHGVTLDEARSYCKKHQWVYKASPEDWWTMEILMEA